MTISRRAHQANSTDALVQVICDGLDPRGGNIMFEGDDLGSTTASADLVGDESRK